MSTPRIILIIGASELGTYVMQVLVHCSHRRDTTISVLLQESPISAKEPSEAERIENSASLESPLLLVTSPSTSKRNSPQYSRNLKSSFVAPA